MEDVKNVVERIVDRCAEEGLQVDRGFAAFVARTVVLENVHDFELNKEMKEDDVQLLIDQCVKKLQERDSPQVETLRMQVEFDKVFAETEESLEASQKAKAKRLNAIKSSIANGDTSRGADFESINTVYRQIFSLLLADADAESTKDQAVEREIAAALESVFPKIGLKAFLGMSAEDQKLQLAELANIVQGVRLFNRHLGKGGAGIRNLPALTRKSAQRLITAAREEKEHVEGVIQDYSCVLLSLHKNKKIVSPEESVVERWRHEVHNRRQYASFLTSLEEDALHTLQNLTKLEDQVEGELAELQDLVGSRSSVPKDQVYPKFDHTAEVWQLIEAEHDLIESRHIVLETLQSFRDSCSFTLDQHLVQVCMNVEGTRSAAETLASLETHESALESKSEREEKTWAKDESKIQDAADREEEEKKDGENTRAVRIFQNETPEFMNFPLKYQGFCPWNVAKRNGLLLPGDPTLGVVEYKGTYQVFSSEHALLDFMADPEGVHAQVLAVARCYPELIQLLDLQDDFPDAGAGIFLRTSRSTGRGGVQGSQLNKPIMVDASTETPVHFVEKHIDPSYEWNEWALRRRALQLVNLRNARTSSTQTVKSHFRRENETQVYLPRHSGTQTGISKATNPPRTFQYISGLRGIQSSKFSKFNQNKDKNERGSTVVRYSFEF